MYIFIVYIAFRPFNHSRLTYLLTYLLWR